MRPLNNSYSYGSRGRSAETNPGIRRVAPTFGKAQFRTYSTKASGSLVVESDAERVVAHMLSIDPRIKSFKQQPFTVDLLDCRICRTEEELSLARARHKSESGQKFYTPDFLAHWINGSKISLEVKLEGFHGDEAYKAKLEIAQSVIRANGHEFLILVIPFRQSHLLRGNLSLLSKAALRNDPIPPLLQSSIEQVCKDDAITVKKLCSILKISPNIVPSLIVRGILYADINQHYINGAMSVRCAYGDLSHLQIIGRDK